MINVCFLIAFIGDYHAPRLKLLSDECLGKGRNLKIAQFRSASSFYSHTQKRRDGIIKHLDVYNFKAVGGIAFLFEIWEYLRRCSPAHIFVLGYNDRASLIALLYAKIFRRKIFFLSDSKSDDHARGRIGELIKSLIIKLFDGALVAGAKHRDYFRSLGYSKPIELGYDVVDNDFFYFRARRYKELSKAFGLTRDYRPFVLCVSRLVSRKRVSLAIKIFFESNLHRSGTQLVIIGSGPEAATLALQVRDLGIQECVFFIPDVPNSRMPFYYAHAVAIILASEYDQWGLCINEAMACGVPAAVSMRCGVANEIVQPERNGFVFAEGDVEGAGRWLGEIGSDPAARSVFSQNCVETMKDWNLKKFSSSAVVLMNDSSHDKID